MTSQPSSMTDPPSQSIALGPKPQGPVPSVFRKRGKGKSVGQPHHYDQDSPSRPNHKGKWYHEIFLGALLTAISRHLKYRCTQQRVQ